MRTDRQWAAKEQVSASIIQDGVTTLRYRASVLDELARHGIMPREETPPDLIHEFVNDLYLIEIRKLRDKARSGAIPKDVYAACVRQLRDRYSVLSLPVRFWTED